MIRTGFIALFATLGLLATPVLADPTPVRLGYIPVMGAAQIFVAESEGQLKGLSLKTTTFESGPAMIQALASGTLDVYVAGVAPLAVARSKGIDVRVIAATAIDEMNAVAGAKLAGFLKPNVSIAQAFKDFRTATGKPARFATQPPGSVPHTTLAYWFDQVSKVDKADYEILTMGIDATQQALLASAVDGATLREPAVTVSMQRDPKLKIVATGSQMFPNQPGTVVAVSGAFLAKNPEATQQLVDGVVAATRIIKTDPERAAGPIEAALGKGLIDRATILKAIASPASKFNSDPRAIIDAFKTMQAYQVKIGSLDKELPLDGLFDASFYMKATGK